MEANGYPQVVYNHPTNKEQGVSLSPEIMIRFSIDIDPDSITQHSFYLKDEYDNILDCDVEYKDQEARLEIGDKLKTNTTYTVVVEGGFDNPAVEDDVVLDIMGNALPEDYTYTFTTVEEIPITKPTITKPQHKTLLEKLEFEWSKVDNTINYDVEVCTDKRFDDVVYSTNVASTSIKPYNLEPEQEYFLRVRANTTHQTSEWSNVNAFYYEPSSNQDTNKEDSKLTSIEVIDLEDIRVAKNISEIKFKINEQLTEDDLNNIDISLVGKSIKNIPYIESDGDVSGSLEIIKTKDTYTLLRYVI